MVGASSVMRHTGAIRGGAGVSQLFTMYPHSCEKLSIGSKFCGNFVKPPPVLHHISHKVNMTGPNSPHYFSPEKKPSNIPTIFFILFFTILRYLHSRVCRVVLLVLDSKILHLRPLVTHTDWVNTCLTL